MVKWSQTPATVQEYIDLRAAAGLGIRTHQAAARGLTGALYAVWLREAGQLVGMGRVIGDGGCFALLADIAVHPDFQGQGWGCAITERLVTWCYAELPESCFISLIASKKAVSLYERAGFEHFIGMGRTIGPYRQIE
ncbi:GNAT family N-acetyltransferase [Pseudaestuariivita rosea]|uniref:GNAT family N-acetyltransferase n=1 Tax=Pseudaestuariivita rosea TaxID=2763263 RepID=UPI001ABB0987|nr:GNAT family N-acetyltransferase [Pseudaestuariivita rosea]